VNSERSVLHRAGRLFLVDSFAAQILLALFTTPAFARASLSRRRGGHEDGIVAVVERCGQTVPGAGVCFLCRYALNTGTGVKPWPHPLFKMLVVMSVVPPVLAAGMTSADDRASGSVAHHASNYGTACCAPSLVSCFSVSRTFVALVLLLWLLLGLRRLLSLRWW
jgi:hypothetical protein